MASPEAREALRAEAMFMSDLTLWADVRKFVRRSANVRNDTAEAITVARSLNERIDAADNEASERILAATTVLDRECPNCGYWPGRWSEVQDDA